MSEVPADPVATIDDVVAQMQAIQQALPPNDGLGAFNRMYLEVTESVRAHIGADFFAAPAFMPWVRGGGVRADSLARECPLRADRKSVV